MNQSIFEYDVRILCTDNMTYSTFVKNLSDVVLKIQQKTEGKVT